MAKITESDIELLAIQRLEMLGYDYIYAPNIAPDFPSFGGVSEGQGGQFPATGGVVEDRGGDQRDSYEQVLLVNRLKNAVKRINKSIPADAQAEAIKEIQRIASPELLANNEAFHRLLTEGIPVSKQVDGNERGDRAWLIDFKNPYNNDFVVANQFTVVENNQNKRPDVILFVNGIPLVVIELKNAVDENATIHSAFKQIETYKAIIPSLFTYNGFVIISDGLEAKAGSISAGFSRFMAWPVCVQRTGRKSADGKAFFFNKFFVYVLECEDGSYYIGQASDLINRWNQHINGQGAEWTKTHKPIRIIHHEIFPSREEAVDREKELKTGFGRKWIKREIEAARNKPFSLDEEIEIRATLKSDKTTWHEGYISQLETLILGMLNKETLIDIIRHFIVFEKTKREDPETGIITITTVKKLAAYHQYYAVNRAVESTLRAAGFPSFGGVVEDRGGQFLPQAGMVNSPPLEGWQTKSDGVVEDPHGIYRNAQNYFDLPYNPKLKERARALRQAGNLTEVLFWNQVKNKQFKGYDFDRQKIIGNYIVDFYCCNCNVVIEIDGSSHDDKQEYDAERDAYLKSLGLVIIHIPAVDILKNLEITMRWLYDHPALRAPLQRRGMSEEGNFVQESPESYGVPGVKNQPVGDRKGGVVWHTQGSGKSLSMVFYTGKIVLALDNPTIVVITDRNDLDDQLFDTFAASKQLLRQEPVQAEDRNQLKDLLKVGSGGVVFTTIQKFQPEEGNVYELLSDRRNIVVIADEAHRTQYGFKAKQIDVKDENGDVIGKKVVYGFAKYMRDALPNATYLGFTGTPIESTDINTPAVFGNYVDIYDIAQAVEDGATVRIYYESRLAKVNLSEEGKKLVAELDDELELEFPSDGGVVGDRGGQKAKAKWTQLEALVGSENRIKQIAKDIIEHFEQRQAVFDGKGMIVTMSRRIAANLYDEITKLNPEWHSPELNKGAIKVVMTSASSDGPKISKHHTTKDQRRSLSERMKNPDDELKLVIVRDMWLTGFDAPSMHTLYIDKPMKGHNLMQAIARVNRVYKDKPGGLVVDYLGIASDLKKALSFYSESGGKGDPTILQEQAVQLMLEKLEVVSQMFNEFPSTGGVASEAGRGGFAYEHYFQAGTSQKLSMILAAEEHILGLEDGKKRYINEVSALSKAFAIAIPHDQAMDAKDEISFFQAVKARLAKFDGTGTGRTDEEIETTIRQVIDKALVSEKVIDVFDAAGIKKPDISILSEDFLMELKGMEHKNVALEVLKKLLNDEIRSRAKKNLVKSKTLMEMLEKAIKKYHNKILTAAEVIEELIHLSKDIVEMDSEAKAMGLTDFEYAFYTAVANNDSARELMQKDKLRELAVVLTDTIKQNASIDWTIKESVKAKLKVAVKRLLRKYGYPPDMQMLATETVLKQAEMIANELTMIN